MPLPKNKKLPNKNPQAASSKGPQFEGPLPHKGKNKGSQGNKGAKKPGGKGKYFGGIAGTGYKGVKKQKVRRLVNGVLREEKMDLREQNRKINRKAKTDSDTARRDYQRGVGDLKHVYGETGDYLSKLQGQNQAMFSDQQSQAQAAQAALQTQLNSTYSGAQSGAMDELNRLGISQGGNFAQLGMDQAASQALAQQSGANTQSSLGMANSNSNALMGLLQGMNQGSYQSQLGQQLNARNDAFGEVRRDKIEGRNEFRAAIRDNATSRRDLFFQLMQQLQQTGWDQFMDKQNLNLQKKSLKK